MTAKNYMSSLTSLVDINLYWETTYETDPIYACIQGLLIIVKIYSITM